MIDPQQLPLFITGFPGDPPSAVTEGAKHGFTNRDACEVSAWCWELAAQVKSLAEARGLPMALIGGTAVQLRIDADLQRSSRDNDYLTTATEAQVEQLMNDLATKFASFPGPLFRPVRKIPGAAAVALPMVTFEVVVPALLGHRNLSGVAQHMIKLEFHFTESLPATETIRHIVFALADPVEQPCTVRTYQIAMKLMTLAADPIGLPPLREDDLPKHTSDLDGLIKEFDLAQWPELLGTVEDLCKQEVARTSLTITPAEVLAQIIARLDHWATAPNWGLIQAVHGQLTKLSSTGPTGWRARFRRLEFFVTCIVSGPAGQKDWADALAEERVILANGDTPQARAAIAAEWPARHGIPMPNPLKSFKAEFLWWELLGI